MTGKPYFLSPLSGADDRVSRHCEEPTGPARSGRPDDRLRDEAIQLPGTELDCFAIARNDEPFSQRIRARVLQNAATMKARREWRDGKEGVVPAFSLSAYARFATRKKMKGYGTPTDALVLVPCCWHGRALSRARTPIGVPPRLWPRRDLLPRALLQATFPGTWNWRRCRNDPHSWGGTDAVFAGVTRLHLSQSSEHLAPQSVVLGG
jgi:hypothetical protein